MKTIILLNTFLEIPWGYMYVFKLGMILEQSQGDVQHGTKVVNYLTLLVGCEVFEKEFDRKFAVWYSGGLTMETRAVTVVTLASTLRPCEVGRWIQAVRNTLPGLLGEIFACFTISKLGQT